MTDEPVRPEEDGFRLIDFLQVISDNLRLLVIGPLLAGLVALGLSYLIKPVFTASTKLMVPQQQQSAAASILQNLGSFGGLPGASYFVRNPADQYVSLLRSRTLQDTLVERFQLVERYRGENRTDARRILDAASAISHAKDGLITVEVDDKDPAFAARLANAYTAELGLLLKRLAVTEPMQRRVFFEKQLAGTKESLVKAEVALKASGINSSALKANPQVAIESMAKLQAAIRVQEIKLASMRGYLNESAPDVKQALMELAVLRGQLGRTEKEDPVAAAAGSDYVARFREVKYQEALFEIFSKQYEIARLDESREGPVIQVVDVAEPPERKSKPKKAQIAVITTLASGLALLLFVLVRDSIRRAGNDASMKEQIGRVRHSLKRALGRA